MTISFSNQLVAEMYQPFWAAWQAGEFLTDASAVAVPTAIAGWLGSRRVNGIEAHGYARPQSHRAT